MTNWYIARSEKKMGPVTASQLKQLAASGQLHPTDMVWHEGMDEWVPGSKVQGLFRPEQLQTKQPGLSTRPATSSIQTSGGNSSDDASGRPTDPVAFIPGRSASGIDSKYKGVRGWLLFFCLVLTTFGPLFTVGMFVHSYHQSAYYLNRVPGLHLVFTVDTILSLGLMAFSIYTGVGLLSIRRGAVQTAKTFLICVLLYHVIAVFLPVMAGLPSQANEAMIPVMVFLFVRGLGFFAIWYLYLSTSKRVKATYES